MPHPAPGAGGCVGSKRSEPAGVRTADNPANRRDGRRDQYGDPETQTVRVNPRTRQPGSGSWVTDPTSRHVVRVRRCGTPRQQPETPHDRIVADGPEEKQPPDDYRDGTGAESASRGPSHERWQLTYGIAMWARMCVWPSDDQKVPRYQGLTCLPGEAGVQLQVGSVRNGPVQPPGSAPRPACARNPPRDHRRTAR